MLGRRILSLWVPGNLSGANEFLNFGVIAVCRGAASQMGWKILTLPVDQEFQLLLFWVQGLVHDAVDGSKKSFPTNYIHMKSYMKHGG